MVEMNYRLFRRKYLLGSLGKLGEVSKQQQVKDNNLTITLSTQSFVTFCFFQPECCFPCQAMLETISAQQHVGLSQAEF